MNWSERLHTLREVWPIVAIFVTVIGGIYGGIFTPTEAAAVSVFYGLIVGILVYREIDLKKIKDILIDSCSTTATGNKARSSAGESANTTAISTPPAQAKAKAPAVTCTVTHQLAAKEPKFSHSVLAMRLGAGRV